MILDQVVLHNFGIYRGRHEVDLQPKAGKPILLFGGLNGGGKTTFLDALLLVLYGKFAQCSNRGALSYEDFLRRTINREVSAKEGAALELTLRHWAQGQEQRLVLHRSWRVVGKTLKEDLEVRLNGLVDAALTNRWYEFVEELIPSQVANLFFFDGERIEKLASAEKSAELVRTGVHALLGLDLLSTLETDLVTIERRRKATMGSETDRIRQKELETELDELESERAQIFEYRAGLKNELTKLLSKQEKLETKYRKLGGELYERREAIQADYDRAIRERHHLEDALRDLAAGPASLNLVRDVLENSVLQARAEADARRSEHVIGELAHRDQTILERLQSLGLARTKRDKLAELLRADLAEREAQVGIERFMNIDPEKLSSVDDATFDEVGRRREDLLGQVDRLEQDITELERTLSAMPDPEGLQGVSQDLDTIEKEVLLAEHEIGKADESYERLKGAVERKQQQIDHAFEIAVKGRFSEEKNQKALAVTTKSRELLVKLKDRLAARHLVRLERLVTESYRLIIRKKTLIHSVQIVPETYEIKIHNEQGDLIRPERLSAGERQLLVVAILWALAKASGRPIPTIIDTPLSRLDGLHRENLVKNYFPAASHQVILLSTDQEIDEAHYASLSSKITRAYRIEYTEKERTSGIFDGYFFKGAA